MGTQFANVEEIAPKSHIYYVDPGEFSRGSLRWSDVQPRQWGDYTMAVYVPDGLQGSDIDRDLVSESNFQVWSKEFDDSEGDKWVSLFGDHGSYGVAIRLDVDDDEIIETLAALEDYPVIDDEALSQLEMDARDEAWSNWVRSDFERALESKEWTIDGRQAEITVYDDDNFDLREWFEKMAERVNEYWITEGASSGVYIDVEHVVAAMDGNDIKQAILDGADITVEAVT